ncbi:MAG: DUF4421 domain-containing protein [Fibrobacter sp.]|nr:DUF4421 domain-containing protein [Fibrobacter sp.]
MYNSLVRLFVVSLTCLFVNTQVFAAEETKTNSSVEDASRKDLVKKFNNLYSIRILTNYNYMSLWSSQFGHTLHSKRPVDIGVGAGFKDLSFDVKYSLGFTGGSEGVRSLCFDTGLDFFPGNFWMHLRYRRYRGFSYTLDEDGSENEDVEEEHMDLLQRDIYLSTLWVMAGMDEFSVRAPYLLDRIQNESAGSLIFGGKIQTSKTTDYDDLAEFHSKDRNIYSAWVHGGYSYTWVFDNLFVNAWALGGLALGVTDNGSFGFFPDVNGKLALGQWHDSWSWNILMQMSYSPSFYKDHIEQKVLGSFEILVVKRF